MSTEKKVVRALRMNSLAADGQVNTHPVTLVVKDPYTGLEIREDDGTPAVVVTLKPISDERHRQIIATHTRLEKNPAGGRQLFEFTDQAAVMEDVLDEGIDSWTGIVAHDDRPLVCSRRSKNALDERVKAQITRKLFGAEAVEVAADSFR